VPAQTTGALAPRAIALDGRVWRERAAPYSTPDRATARFLRGRRAIGVSSAHSSAGRLGKVLNYLDRRDRNAPQGVIGGRAAKLLPGATSTYQPREEDIMSDTVISALFDSHAEAERAVSELRGAGVSDNALSVIAHHGGTTTTTSGDGEITDESHRNVLRGILGGGALGAGLGVAALAIPGVGPLAAAGAIAAAVVPESMAIGAAAGAVAGTLNETLTKHGVSKEDAGYYNERMKDGAVFVSVDTSSAGVSTEAVRDILHRHGGHNASRARSATY
jgi:hypothetical protein